MVWGLGFRVAVVPLQPHVAGTGGKRRACTSNLTCSVDGLSEWGCDSIGVSYPKF